MFSKTSRMAKSKPAVAMEEGRSGMEEEEEEFSPMAGTLAFFR